MPGWRARGAPSAARFRAVSRCRWGPADLRSFRRVTRPGTRHRSGGPRRRAPVLRKSIITACDPGRQRRRPPRRSQGGDPHATPTRRSPPAASVRSRRQFSPADILPARMLSRLRENRALAAAARHRCAVTHRTPDAAPLRRADRPTDRRRRPTGRRLRQPALPGPRLSRGGTRRQRRLPGLPDAPVPRRRRQHGPDLSRRPRGARRAPLGRRGEREPGLHARATPRAGR